MAIINDAGQSMIHCKFCGECCRSDQISYIKIGTQIWKLGPFCKHFATAETVTQLLNKIHPNNIEKAYGKVIAWEWEEDKIDYI